MTDMAQPVETVRLLVETLHADVNYRDVKSGSGESALMLCVNKPDVGRYLLSKGADIFLKDRKGESAISATLTKQNLWLLEEYCDSEQETEMLGDSNETRLREYVSWLAFAGYATQLEKLIRRGDVMVTAAQATILMELCASNFKHMQEPVETYELLDKLMSTAL
jgi:hypothetical protein